MRSTGPRLSRTSPWASQWTTASSTSSSRAEPSFSLSRPHSEHRFRSPWQTDGCRANPRGLTIMQMFTEFGYEFNRVKSVASHLQVPQSPSQPIVALNAPPNPTLSVITGDNSPTSARGQHRLPSVSSSAGFSSAPGHGPDQGSADRGKTGMISEEAGSSDDDNDELEKDESDRDHPAKIIKGLKKRLFAHTKADRIKSEQARLDEERKRALKMDTTPFHHCPYAFADPGTRSCSRRWTPVDPSIRQLAILSLIADAPPPPPSSKHTHLLPATPVVATTTNPTLTPYTPFHTHIHTLSQHG
ncbi:hypothetical protein V8E36_004939 [Tilletia maclaganii]